MKRIKEVLGTICVVAGMLAFIYLPLTVAFMGLLPDR